MPRVLTKRPDEDEPQNVFQWRFKELREAGYSLGAAMRLAETEEADLHCAVELLKRGCSEETALEILL